MLASFLRRAAVSERMYPASTTGACDDQCEDGLCLYLFITFLSGIKLQRQIESIKRQSYSNKYTCLAFSHAGDGQNPINENT